MTQATGTDVTTLQRIRERLDALVTVRLLEGLTPQEQYEFNQLVDEERALLALLG